MGTVKRLARKGVIRTGGRGGYEKGKWGIYWHSVYTHMKLSKENRVKRSAHFKEWAHTAKLCEDQWTVERTFPSFQDGETHNVTTWTEQLRLQARFLYQHSDIFHKLPSNEFLQLSRPVLLSSHHEDFASDKTHSTIRVTLDAHISPTPHEHLSIQISFYLFIYNLNALSWASHLSLVSTSPRCHKYL